MTNKNLKPFNTLTEEEQKEIARKGGKASVKSRREKKRMSQIYATFLEKEHEITIEDGKKIKITGDKFVAAVMTKILNRGDGSSVSLIKELREGIEGNKLSFDEDGLNITFRIKKDD